MRTTHAALLGCGHPHSSSHLQTLVTLPEVAGIHLWDPEPAVAETLRAAAGPKLVAVHPRLDDLLSDGRLGWGLASLRSDVGPEILLRCAEAGLPVMAEKPIGRSHAEVAPVVAAFRERGLALGVCFQNRWKPAARLLRDWVAEGLLGRPCVAETRLHTTQVKLRDPRHWLFNQRLSGGGILPWLGCHYLDLLRWILRDEVVTVTAQCATASGEAIDVEDLAVLTLRFAGGVLATATFGYLMPGGNPGYLSPGYDTILALKGTGGWANWTPTGTPQVLDAYSTAAAWVGGPGRRWEFAEEPALAYGGRAGAEFLREFHEAALDGRDGPTTGEDLLAVWAIIEAAYRASRDGVSVVR